VASRREGDSEAARLVRDLCEGDAEAWEAFLQRYRRLVYSAIHRANGRFCAGWDETIMEEIFEDAVYKLLRQRGRALASWRGQCKLETWIYRIVRNVCIDRLRKESRRAEVSNLDEARLSEAARAGARRPDDADLRLSLEQAIERVLGPREALAIRLIYFEGFTYREVAERLEMTVGAMSGFVYRALAKLRNDGGLPVGRGERR
jgi:RNA polymerase sigma factor (sigma-70 family)